MRDAALAIHVCADIATAGADRHWPPIESIDDTLRRARAICQHVGVMAQQVLSGAEATIAGALDALERARVALAAGGLLVLSFAGHTERGNRPVEQARWCLFDGGLELGRVARALALFAEDVRIVVIADTCYASALASTLIGTQSVLVLASCGEAQTTTIRMHSDSWRGSKSSSARAPRKARSPRCATISRTTRRTASGRASGPTPRLGGRPFRCKLRTGSAFSPL